MAGSLGGAWRDMVLRRLSEQKGCTVIDVAPKGVHRQQSRVRLLKRRWPRHWIAICQTAEACLQAEYEVAASPHGVYFSYCPLRVGSLNRMAELHSLLRWLRH